jgi:serine/threonine protein kinase
MHGASHEILGRLAVGGMAELYLARTTHASGRRELVVLKRILPHLSEDPDFVRMFRDEAFLAATLDHPNIVRVHDIGQDGEDYFFTMEYVHGENVRTIIKAAQKLDVEIPLEHVIQIALGVCEGLHYAHEQVDEDGTPLRIVHRDVSPTNILVSFRGDVKIVDFGIAKAAAATHVTQAGMLKGKASYMSPEQCRAEPVDRRSDVFAIGILVYEMTTLTRLFRGDNELAVLHQILTGTIEAPSTRVDDYPSDLERIVMKALAQRPADRYPTALAMHDDLVKLARSRGFEPSRDALGELVRELCGERPSPWDEEELPDEDELEDDIDDALLVELESVTGMPTAMGNFEDEEDTKVNRRGSDARTIVPGAPSGWTGSAALPAVLPAVRAGGSRDTAGRLRLPGKGLPRRPAPSAEGTVPAPGANDEALTATDGPVPSDATMPMAKPGAARSPAPRLPGPRGAAQPETMRSGRTLPGAAGGLAGPLPPRSGRTVPGAGLPAVGVGSTPNPSMVAPVGQSSLPGAADRTQTAGAGSRPRVPTRQPRPGHRSPGTPLVGEPQAAATSDQAPTQPHPRMKPEPQAPSTADRTMAMTPEQARAIAQHGTAALPPSHPVAPVSGRSAWEGAGVDRTELAPGLAREPVVDERARTLAMQRFDQGANASRALPNGPMGWDDPMTRTQKTTPSDPVSLTSTQKSPVQSLGAMPRTSSAAHPTVPAYGDLGVPGGELADLRRPEMRSPAPRPPSTPSSLWVPVLLVVIVALASTAVWLWLSSGR